MNANQKRALAGALLLLSTQQALAWGGEGHRITGTIAQRLLTPAARDQVQHILPGADFAVLSTWMDQHKFELKHRLPGSDKWHYQDEPVCDGEVEDACPDGNCAGNKIEVYRKVLADQSASIDARREALTFLIHLVGDIAQPLHAANNHDRGGNQVKVTLPRGVERAAELHALWDSSLVALAVGKEDIGSWSAREMETYGAQFAEWRQGSVGQWISESNQLARSEVYQPLPVFACGGPPHDAEAIDRDYLERAEPVVREQLVKAGVRIAEVINSALDQGAVLQ